MTDSKALNEQYAEDLALIAQIAAKRDAANKSALVRLYGVTDPDEADNIMADFDGYSSLYREATRKVLRQIGGWSHQIVITTKGEARIQRTRGWTNR
jgi:hypothetical protein